MSQPIMFHKKRWSAHLPDEGETLNHFYLCHVSKFSSARPRVLGACGLSLSCEFMSLKNVSNININLIKGMETFIIYKKHILDI